MRAVTTVRRSQAMTAAAWLRVEAAQRWSPGGRPRRGGRYLATAL